MVLLLLRVAELVLAAILLFQSLRGLIGMLPRSEGAMGIGGGTAWSTPIARLGVGLVLIALASAAPHRDYPFAILAAALIAIVVAVVLHRRERAARKDDGRSAGADR